MSIAFESAKICSSIVDVPRLNLFLKLMLIENFNLSFAIDTSVFAYVIGSSILMLIGKFNLSFAIYTSALLLNKGQFKASVYMYISGLKNLEGPSSTENAHRLYSVSQSD